MRRSLKEIGDEYHQKERMELGGFTLRMRYDWILFQCMYFDRSDDVLIEYMLELEYRNMEYEQPWE